MLEWEREAVVNRSDANLRNVHHVPVVGLVPRYRSVTVMANSVRMNTESIRWRRKRDEVIVDGVGAAVEAAF